MIISYWNALFAGSPNRIHSNCEKLYWLFSKWFNSVFDLGIWPNSSFKYCHKEIGVMHMSFYHETYYSWQEHLNHRYQSFSHFCFQRLKLLGQVSMITHKPKDGWSRTSQKYDGRARRIHKKIWISCSKIFQIQQQHIAKHGEKYPFPLSSVYKENSDCFFKEKYCKLENAHRASA